MLKRIFSSIKQTKCCLIICSVLSLCNYAYASTDIPGTPHSMLPKLCIDAWNNILNCQQQADSPFNGRLLYAANYNLDSNPQHRDISLFSKIEKSCRISPPRQQYNDIWQHLELLSEVRFIFNTHSTFNIEMDPTKGQVSEVTLSYQNCW